jgi:hypothetical protein
LDSGECFIARERDDGSSGLAPLDPTPHDLRPGLIKLRSSTMAAAKKKAAKKKATKKAAKKK